MSKARPSRRPRKPREFSIAEMDVAADTDRSPHVRFSVGYYHRELVYISVDEADRLGRKLCEMSNYLKQKKEK